MPYLTTLMNLSDVYDITREETHLGIFPNVWVMVYGVQVGIYQIRWYDMTTQPDGARRPAAYYGNGAVIPQHLLNEQRQVTEHVQVGAEIYTGTLFILQCIGIELNIKIGNTYNVNMYQIFVTQ